MQDRPTATLAVKVSPAVAEIIDRMAAEGDRTRSQELRRAIRQYVSPTENGRPQKPTVLQNRAETEREYGGS